MAYPPLYSFHHQPGVINFTHLCSPSPHLHYQDLIPPLPYSQPQPPNPAANVKSLLHQILHSQRQILLSQQTLQHTLSAFATDFSNLSTKLAPKTFTHTSVTFPFVTPISSLNPQQPIYYPTNLSHHSPQPPQKPCDLRLPTKKEKNNDASVLLAPTLMSHDKLVETGERSQELVVAAETDLEETLHPDPPSNFQMISLFPLPSFESNHNTASTTNFTGLQFGDLSNFTAIDLVHLSCSANFVLKHVVSSSATKLERAVVIFVFETENTTAKMIGNTIFVFDPGGIFSFYELSSATVTISAAPLHRSSFVFDPDRIKSDVCRHLSNQTFQKALSSGYVSILVSSSSFSTMVLFFNIPLPTNLVLLDTACTPDLTDLTIIPQPREGDMELALAAAIVAVPSHAIAARSGSASGDDWEKQLGFPLDSQQNELLIWAITDCH